MAYLNCTREVTVKPGRVSKYSAIPGKKMMIWPPGDCGCGTNLADKFCVEKLTHLYKTLKDKYGFSLLMIPLNGDHYAAATLAGWDNKDIVLNVGWFDILDNTGVPGIWKDAIYDPYGNMIQPAVFLPSLPTGMITCNPEHFTCKVPPRYRDSGSTRNFTVPTCSRPTFRVLLDHGCISAYDAYYYGLLSSLIYFKEINENLVLNIKGRIGPFYAIYQDESWQQNIIDDVTKQFRFGIPATNDPRFPAYSTILLSNIVKQARGNKNPFFTEGQYSTEYWVSGANSYLHPLLLAEEIFSNVKPDKVWYSGYKDIGENELTDWIWGLFNSPRGYDQRVEWDKLKPLDDHASVWISLQADAEEGTKSSEFTDLLGYINDANWEVFGIFGGNEYMNCQAFYNVLELFCSDAVLAGWLQDDSYYSQEHRKTLYCWEPNCQCDPSLPEGWRDYAPPVDYHDPSQGTTNQGKIHLVNETEPSENKELFSDRPYGLTNDILFSSYNSTNIASKLPRTGVYIDDVFFSMYDILP